MQRPVEKWYLSFSGTFLESHFGFVGALVAFVIQPALGSSTAGVFRRLWQGFFAARLREGIRANARRAYLQHCADVRAAAREQGIPILDHELGSGWRPLCGFLEKAVPNAEFPEINDYETLRTLLKAVRRRQALEAMRVVLTKYFLHLAAILVALCW